MIKHYIILPNVTRCNRFIEESPQWLFAVGKPEKARAVLKKISKYNNADEDCDDKTLLEEERKAQKSSVSDSEGTARTLLVAWRTFLRKPRLLAYFGINVFTW